MALVEPLETDHDDEMVSLVAFFEETLGFTPNSVLTMQRRPAIAKAFIALNMAVMENHGRVTAEQKRLIGHIASLTAGCRYCQAHTALAAKRYGASEARLAAIWEYDRSDVFTPAEKAAFTYARAASAVPSFLDEAICADLKAHWHDDEIVEIAGVVALFGYLNRWNDSMATPLEPGGAAAGLAHLAAQGWDVGKHG